MSRFLVFFHRPLELLKQILFSATQVCDAFQGNFVTEDNAINERFWASKSPRILHKVPCAPQYRNAPCSTIGLHGQTNSVASRALSPIAILITLCGGMWHCEDIYSFVYWSVKASEIWGKPECCRKVSVNMECLKMTIERI